MPNLSELFPMPDINEEEAALPRGEATAPTGWAVHCPHHGLVYLAEGEYIWQLSRADDFWRCPRKVADVAHPDTGRPGMRICGASSVWDDDVYEDYQEALQSAAEGKGREMPPDGPSAADSSEGGA